MHALTAPPDTTQLLPPLDPGWRCPDYPPTDWLPPVGDGYDPHGDDGPDDGFEFGCAADDVFTAIASVLGLVLAVVALPLVLALLGAVV